MGRVRKQEVSMIKTQNFQIINKKKECCKFNILTRKQFAHTCLATVGHHSQLLSSSIFVS